MKRPVEKDPNDRLPQKYSPLVRAQANHPMAPKFLNNERGDSTSSDQVVAPSACSCIGNQINKIEVPRELWFNNVRSRLDDECYGHEDTCPKYMITTYDTPLHSAVKKGNEKIVELLAKDKASVDSKAEYGLTPLHIGVYKGNLQIVKILLEHGASIDCECYFQGQNCWPLDLAIIGRHASIVKLLLSRGSNGVLTKNNDSFPSNVLENNESYIVISTYLLMSRLDRSNENRKISLLEAADLQILEYCDVVRHVHRVCSYFHDTERILRELMHHAVERGFSRVVEDFLVWGVNIDIINYTAHASFVPRLTLLHTAVEKNLYEIAKLLIDHGADVNATDSVNGSPISCAFDNNNAMMLKLLTNKEAHRIYPRMLLSAVSTSKSKEIVEILLKNDFGVDTRDEFGRTLLHISVLRTIMRNGLAHRKKPASERGCHDYTNSMDIVELLLSNGADVDARDDFCNMPIHIAAVAGHVKLIEILLEHDPKNFDALGEHSATPLILAAGRGSVEVIKILLKFGANVNSKDEDGKTGLIRATECENVEAVEILLQHNADIDVTMSNNDTALDIAMNRVSSSNAAASSRLITLLLRSGVDINAVNRLNRDTCSSAHMPTFLENLIVKMKAADMYVDEKKFKFIFDRWGSNYYCRTCEEEVAALKKDKIADSTFSLYDILTKDAHQLAIVCRNTQIAEALESEYYKECCPVYSQLIENNFKKGQKRRDLMDRASYSFNRLIGNDFLDFLSADILKFLHNKDLQNLAQVPMR